MKRILCALVVFLIARITFAGPDIQLAKGIEPERFDIRLGVGYSMDSYDNGQDVIVYVQMPVVDLRFLWVNFGFVTPIDFDLDGRSPLSLALTTSLEQWIDCPVWLNWEIGTFYTPQLESWGFEVGLVNMRF